ncbi:MAG: replication initiation factor domain-containing protein [Clostridia bacterium]|nr:replication initiation factor domain-containing protein [Clostridia bacterium]
MKNECKVIIDWLSVTSKCYSVADFIDFLGLQSAPWIETKGAHGYRRRMYFECISIHFDGNDSVWLEMSGQGCRAFESFGTGDFTSIFALCDSGDFKLTRLDVAFDDRFVPEMPGEECFGILDMAVLAGDTLAHNFVSKSTEWEVLQSSKGCSVVIGSYKSDVLIRIYDKARERNYTDGTHWVRVELQLRNDRALAFSRIKEDIGAAFAGVLLNYLRYVVPQLDSNPSRWPLTEYWSNLIKSANRISIYIKPGTEYNLLQCENYVFNQAGNAIDALIDLYGVDLFVEKLKSRSTKPNPKYVQAVESAKISAAEKREKVLDEIFDRGKELVDDLAPIYVHKPFWDKVQDENLPNGN